MTTITVEQVIASLRDPAVAITSEQIRECFDVLKARHASLATVQALAFRAGDVVAFDDRGHVLTGTVTKINSRTVSVKVGAISWRVGATLLRSVKRAA